MSDKVAVIPYDRERMPRDILYTLWLLVEEAGDWKDIFWYDAEVWPYHQNLFADLPYFIHYMTNIADPKLLLLVIDVAEDRVVGFIWFSAIDHQHKTCDGNIWMHPKYRGARTIEAMHKACGLVFRSGGETIYGVTKNVKSRNNSVKRCGWVQEAYFEKTKIYRLRLDKTAWEELDAKLTSKDSI